ncbi:class I SAM-dependent methyltransferase [Psychromonas sp. KJ10-2]|uniref:class I SAM-dependent methyltransferase n=1 Tax=Psychromonas sp. KJ10-2 TaxID=3391822 RepID=UPI0039B38370
MNTHTRSSTLKIVEELKAAGNDFEFYPTKISQLDVIKKDIKEQCLISSDDPITESVLDIGCGTGSALEYLTEGKRYAIEKAPELIKSLDKSIFIVGTDYHAQSLLDKKVAIVFMNPIFSEFENWTLKLINESNAEFAYLILPVRWEKSESIKDALKERSASITILATDTYLDAFRQARATVHVLRVNFANKRQSYFRGNQVNVDPFKLWFNTHFKINAKKPNSQAINIKHLKRKH